MLFLDVNICVYAFRPSESDQARAVHDWLTEQLNGSQTLAVCELVLSAMMRIATNPRLFTEPATPTRALEFADSLLMAANTIVVRPGTRHWAVFRNIMSSGLFRANDVHDAYYAALAIEQGATMVTRDRGFRRFDGLRVLDPLA